jgi:predicted ArsR family transcriptional regulator
VDSAATRDDRVLADYAERLAGLLTNAGFPRMPARVLMTLMVADTDGLTASQLAERLNCSAAAISGAVRYLQTVGMVRRVSQPGRRRDRYELPHHAWYTATLDRNPFYDAGIALSEQALAATGDREHPAVARIAEMIDFFRFIERRMPELVSEWRARPASARMNDRGSE